MSHALGFPSCHDFKKAISLNFIKNLNVTCTDVDLAESIYGVDVHTKKGKNQKNSSKTIHDNIYIPDKITPLNKKMN